MKKTLVAIAALLYSISVTASPWANESQLAVISTSGNSITESYSLKQTTSYTHEASTLKATVDYLRTDSQNTNTALKWDAGFRYDHKTNEKWSMYIGYLVESDIFAGYLQRHNSDIGGKYLIVKTDGYTITSELGYRYVHQNNTNNSQLHHNSARIYLEGIYNFNSTTSGKLWAEYTPSFEDSTDYLFNSETSLSAAMNSVFSLKISYLSKTANKPVGNAVKTDSTTTAALVAKF